MIKRFNSVMSALVLSLAASCPAVHADQAPGTVLSATPMTAQLLPLLPIQAKAWKITYSSTTVTGEPTVVGGTVLVPKAAWKGAGPRPLLGYAIGTQGLADRCAPSRQLAQGSEYEAILIDLALKQGWAIALTDYPGLGTPGTHPYVVGKALGRAVLDSMRAAKSLAAAGIAPNAPLGVFGYSEGGGAAGWALQLQPTYAPDLPLAGGAAGAAPSDLLGQYDFLNGSPFAFLILYVSIGFDAAYPELNLASYLNDMGRKAVDAYQDTCIIQAVTKGLGMSRQATDYVTVNPLETPAWRARLLENSLGAIAPQTPVMVGGGKQDEVISNESQRALYKQWCQLGVNAHLADIKLGEHILAAPQFAAAAFPFLADRFAGKPIERAVDCQ